LGTIAGTYVDANGVQHGFGVITGYRADANNVFHGFLRIPKRKPEATKKK